MSNLTKMTVRELRQFCVSNKVQGYSRYVNSKGALIDYIQTWLMQESRKLGLGSNARVPSTAPVVIAEKVKCVYSAAPKSEYFADTSRIQYVQNLGVTEKQALRNAEDAVNTVKRVVKQCIKNTTHLLSDDREPVRVSKPWSAPKPQSPNRPQLVRLVP